ncbi:MAG: PASTA domain-containing protein [Prevotella sp.]|nr:PASTA domain-containing protein [Bacteroides sp.]MCM1366635.1 PASTA domain-containing protein [Prevotella sp.]MCM1437000.1 PASTA domain-containing protein [Prevotella sp.]
MSQYREFEDSGRNGDSKSKHPVLANIVIIGVVALLGVVILYLSLAIFTKHGRETRVPRVEKMSYTDAISKLHDAGFKIEIRDSVYTDNVKPGYVIEQFPKANSLVKPGRKIFLYIQAVHPKEVVIDDDNNPRLDALRGMSLRSAVSHLEELGFKKIRLVRVLGAYEGVAKVICNGRVVKKMQRIPINSQLTLQVYDGRLRELSDSLLNIEFGNRRFEELSHESGYSSEPSVEYSTTSNYSSEPVAEPEYTSPEPSEGSKEESNPYLE